MNLYAEPGELINLTPYMKPRIRPLRFGDTLIWECRAQRVVDRDGWVIVEAYGKRGHGYSPQQAYQEWEDQTLTAWDKAEPTER